MIITGTEAAFKALLSKRGIYKQIGMSASHVSQMKSGVRKASLEKMEELLLKSGAKVVREKQWEINLKTNGNSRNDQRAE